MVLKYNSVQKVHIKIKQNSYSERLSIMYEMIFNAFPNKTITLKYTFFPPREHFLHYFRIIAFTSLIELLLKWISYVNILSQENKIQQHKMRSIVYEYDANNVISACDRYRVVHSFLSVAKQVHLKETSNLKKKVIFLNATISELFIQPGKNFVSHNLIFE